MKILMAAFFLTALLILLRLFFKTSIWEKVLSFNLFSMKVVLILLLYAEIRELDYLMDIAFIYVLLGFMSIVFITRFIRKRGKI